MIANANKVAAEIRSIFTKAGGSLGQPGSVAFGFTQQGVILIDASNVEEDAVMEAALEAGAEDFKNEEGLIQVSCDPTDFLTVREALQTAGFQLEQAEVREEHHDRKTACIFS